eukprot:scaffold175314_cov37-Prasinocladus_malaysianus.AAC.3
MNTLSIRWRTSKPTVALLQRPKTTSTTSQEAAVAKKMGCACLHVEVALLEEGQQGRDAALGGNDASVLVPQAEVLHGPGRRLLQHLVLGAQQLHQRPHRAVLGDLFLAQVIGRQSNERPRGRPLRAFAPHAP